MKSEKVISGTNNVMKKLVEILGPIRAIRFMENYDNGGTGDYTKEKYEMDELSMNEIRGRLTNETVIKEDTNYGENEEISFAIDKLDEYVKSNNLAYNELDEDIIKQFITIN